MSDNRKLQFVTTACENISLTIDSPYDSGFVGLCVKILLYSVQLCGQTPVLSHF